MTGEQPPPPGPGHTPGQPAGSPAGGAPPPPPPPRYQPPGAGAQGAPGQPGYGVGPQDEGNAPAITSLVLGVIGLVLVLVSFGLLSVLTIFLGIAAVILGVMGRKRVRTGRTTQHGGLAMGGLVTGIIATVLSLAGLVACGAIVSTDDFQKGFQQGYEQQQRQQQP
jgi:hypothetical protein